MYLRNFFHGDESLRFAFISLQIEAGKTRPCTSGCFREAVEREASRLDRSGGSLYDAFAAGCPLPQVRINLSDLAICLLLLRDRVPVGPCRYAAATPRRVRETASTKLVRISTLARCTLLGLYVRDRLVD